MLNRAIAPDEKSEEGRLIIGKAVIVRLVYEGEDISPIWNKLFRRVSADTGDAAAFLDFSIILQCVGQADKASLAQRAALDISRSYRIRNGDGSGSRILAFVTAGDFMANTPIEFLLEGSDTTLLLHYIDADTKDLADVPDHDVAFVAVGESAAKTIGTERIGDAILHTCELASYLAEQLARSSLFELKAPVSLNIVCFAVSGAGDEFNRELVMDLQEAGVAAPSWTTLNGELVIRCAIVNHRTTRSDIDLFLEAIGSLARARLNTALDRRDLPASL